MGKIKDILHRLAMKTGGFLRDRNIFTFCLFLIFTAILWYGHAMNAVRERTLSVGIEYTGVPDNIAFEKALPKSFRFTVRDQGKRLQKYKETSFVPVEIDLSAQLTGKEGHIHLTADQVRSKIADQLQGTAKIQNVQPDVIETNYYTQAKKKVTVMVAGELTPAEQYMFTDEVIATPNTIVIYGKKEALDTINSVNTMPLKEADIRDSLKRAVCLQPIEGIRFTVDTVFVSVYSEQFTEKKMTLDILTRGVETGVMLRTFPSTCDVTVRIALSHFNDVDETDIKAVCIFPKTEQTTLPIHLEYNNPYIIQTRVTPEEAEYVIETQRN